jgi:hypothetical protein
MLIPCLICGRPADSKEHYISQWLSKAAGRNSETIVRGATIAGKMTSAKNHGTAAEAFEKNLCGSCNNGLGDRLESPVSALLKPMMAGDFARVRTLSAGQRLSIAAWGVLHALEHDFLDRHLDDGPKGEFLNCFRRILAGEDPALPGDLHVHLASATHPEMGFFLSKQLLAHGRGAVNALGSFCWAMQAEHLILTVARVPAGARLLPGWGYAIWPSVGTDLPLYDDIAAYNAVARISVS